jgi:UMF1 family MFS transporter
VADARAQSLWSLGQTISGILIALCAPILGAFADNTGRRMPWIVLFSIFYVAGAAALWFTLPDGSFLIGALIAFGIGLIGAEFTTIFTNSMLPELGEDSAIGRLSGTGFAWGYTGGVLALFIMLIFFAEGRERDDTSSASTPPSASTRRRAKARVSSVPSSRLVRGLHDPLLPVGAGAAPPGHAPDLRRGSA